MASKICRNGQMQISAHSIIQITDARPTYRVGEFALSAQLGQQLDRLRDFVIQIDAVFVFDDGGLGSLLFHGAVAFAVVAAVDGIVIGIDRILKLEFGVLHASLDHVLNEHLSFEENEVVYDKCYDRTKEPTESNE